MYKKWNQIKFPFIHRRTLSEETRNNFSILNQQNPLNLCYLQIHPIKMPEARISCSSKSHRYTVRELIKANKMDNTDGIEMAHQKSADTPNGLENGKTNHSFTSE